MLCSNPRCQKRTSGPREDPNKALVIGVAAHITAASADGPRFDSSLTPTERGAITNGIWLCQNCAAMIDRDVARYTVVLLKNWKQQAEEVAREALESNLTVDDPQAAVARIPSTRLHHAVGNLVGRPNDLVAAAEGALARGDLRVAKEHIAAVLAQGSVSPQVESKFCEMGADLAEREGDGATARSHLWRLRELVIRQKIRRSLTKVDSRIRHTIFHTDSRTWAASAGDYAEFLRSFPTCLQIRLCELIAAQLQVQALLGNIRSVLDICCGTGLLAHSLDALRLRLRVVGYDIPEMIRIAENSWDDSSPGNVAGHEFRDIEQLNRDALCSGAKSFDSAVMNMAIFQFGLRERLTLLRDVGDLLRDDALFWISTQAPDFEFPGNDFNRENPFKHELYRVWQKIGFYPDRNAREAATPVFSKDTVDSIRHLLNSCGFDLISAAESLPIVESHRTIDERIAFTQMEVISRKVFGKTLESKWWNKARERLSDWKDSIYGTVLLARRTSPPARYVFVHLPAAPQQRCEKVIHAAAAVLRSPKRETLLVKRGELSELVRDFPHTWSLPSSMGKPGVSLAASLQASVHRHLGIDVPKLRPLAVRVSKRGGRDLFVMTLFEADVGRKVMLRSKKYSQVDWCTSEDVFRVEAGCHGLGDCVTCYQDVLRSGWR